MKFNSVYTLYLSLFISACTAGEPKVQSNGIDEIISYVQSEYQAGRFNGSLAVGTKDELLYTNAFGLANREWDVKINDSTSFDIASLNKSFQAALVLKAEEEGLLKLNDKLYLYFPNLNFDTSITIHHLLTHTSGIPDYDAINDDLKADNFKKFKRSSFTTKQYAAFISSLKLIGTPGIQFHYSNFGYHLICLILEDVYHKHFSELLQEKICRPYKLEHTYAETDNRVIHLNAAEGYTFSKKDSGYLKNNFIDLSLGRRIFSTSIDLYRWALILMNGEFISDSSYSKMTTNHLKGIEEHISYGYGLVVFDGGDYRLGKLNTTRHYVIHGGNTEGYKSMMVNINNGELIISLLSNTANLMNELEMLDSMITLYDLDSLQYLQQDHE